MTDDLVAQVTELYNRKQLKEALAIVDGALAVQHKDTVALYLRASIKVANYEWYPALRDIEKVIELGFSNNDTNLLLGKIRYSLGDLDAAGDAFRKIPEGTPRHSEALHGLGKVSGFAEANYGPRHLKRVSAQYESSLAKTEKGVRRAIYSARNEQVVLHELVALLDCRKYCIDIGALDGITFSNSFWHFANGWGGLVFECKRENMAWLAHNLRDIKQDISIVGTFVTPTNILDLLTAFAVPNDFGFLSLDIDSYDYEILSLILSKYRPAVICTEINERIPPPIKFRQVFNNENAGLDCGVYGGCSIAAYEELLSKHDYSIVHLEYNNIFAIHDGDLARVSPKYSKLSAEIAWRIGYFEKNDKYSWMPWNKRFDSLSHVSAEQAKDQIRQMMPFGIVYELE